MSTENPVIGSFKGLGPLEVLLQEVTLKIAGFDTLTPATPVLRCDSSSIPDLALTLRPEFADGDLAEALRFADLEPQEIEVVVSSEDSFLKQRDVLLRIPGGEGIGAEYPLTNSDSERPRSLQNPNEGLKIQVAVVLDTALEPASERPYRKGTKLAGVDFRVKPYTGLGSIQPVPLTDEVGKEHGLSKKTQLFIVAQDEILASGSLEDLVTVYVEEGLLQLLKRERSDSSFRYVADGVVIDLLQQLTLMASRDMAAAGSTLDLANLEEEGSAVVEQIQDILGEVKRVGVKGKPSFTETARMIRDEPFVVCALISAIRDFTSDARNLASPDEGPED